MQFLQGLLVLLKSGTLSSQFGAVLANGNIFIDSSGMAQIITFRIGESWAVHFNMRQRIVVKTFLVLFFFLELFFSCKFVGFRDTNSALCATVVVSVF